MIDAIVLAGGMDAPDSPLYPYTKGKSKATIEIGGKPMLQWVLDALEDAEKINRIVVVGSPELQPDLRSTKVASFLPDTGDLVINFKTGADAILEINPSAERVVIVTADIPFVTPESVNWVIDTSLKSNEDLFYFVIDQPAMENKYPGSARSYTRLKDLSVCGGDVTVIRLDLYTKKKEFWKKIARARKSSLRLAALIGIDILFLLMLRRLTLDDAVRRVTQRLEITGRGLICPFPEIGMDIDKPYQLELAREMLSSGTNHVN